MRCEGVRGPLWALGVSTKEAGAAERSQAGSVGEAPGVQGSRARAPLHGALGRRMLLGGLQQERTRL